MLWNKLLLTSRLGDVRRCGQIIGYNTKRFTGSLIKCDVNQETGVAELGLNRPPANAFNYDLLSSIVSTIDKVENHHKCTGMLWYSTSKKIFIGGLDLHELTDPHPDDIRKFWTTFQEFAMRLYGSPIPMVNAINSHAIAGGMTFVLSADYNVCSKGNFKFGLNETVFGLFPPLWLQKMLIRPLGERTGEKYIKMGTLFNAEKALQLGVVDELVEPDELMSSARHQINKWIQYPASSQREVKAIIRKPLIKLMKDIRQEELDYRVKSFTDPDTIRNLKSYIDKLQQRKS